MVERGHEKTGADTYPQQFKCPAAGRRRRPDGRLNRRVDVYCNPTATPASPISTKQRKAFYPHGTVCMLLLKVRFSNNGDRNYVSSVWQNDARRNCPKQSVLTVCYKINLSWYPVSSKLIRYTCEYWRLIAYSVYQNCGYWSVFVEVIWKYNRVPFFLNHSVVINVLLSPLYILNESSPMLNITIFDSSNALGIVSLHHFRYSATVM